MRKTILFFVALAVAFTAAVPAHADTVADWWDFANRISLTSQASDGPQSPDQFRAVSRVALAMFEAVNAIDRRYESYLNFPPADSSASVAAAAATAAARVLLASFPAQRSAIEESYAIAIEAIPGGPARDGGRAIGEHAATAAMKAAGIDPAIAAEPYRPRTTPGQWIATGLPVFESYILTFRPWVIPSAEALAPQPPPALTSATWARDYDEVRRLGSRTSTERTPHQTLIALYRRAFDITPSLRMVAHAPGRTPVQNARMFALYQMAVDDAALAMVAAKFRYNFWRPITAIRNGAHDGNDATQPEPGWVPLLVTPNHPEYPCGHCTIAAAIAEVMTDESGLRPRGGVRVGSEAIQLSAVQVLQSWDEWAREVSDSRIYAGVHYRFSNEAGEKIGRAAARMVLERVMQPLTPKLRTR